MPCCSVSKGLGQVAWEKDLIICRAPNLSFCRVHWWMGNF